MTAVTVNPPIKAVTTSVQLPKERGRSGNHRAPITMVMPAASAAPLLIPINPGSASGLRNMPCIKAPAMPSPAPAASPSSMRGRRMLRKINCSGVRSWLPVMPAHRARGILKTSI